MKNYNDEPISLNIFRPNLVFATVFGMSELFFLPTNQIWFAVYLKSHAINNRGINNTNNISNVYEYLWVRNYRKLYFSFRYERPIS